MSYEHLLLEIKDRVALVTINRHERRNALTAQTIDELDRLFSDLETADIGAVVITGSGDKAFCMGADIEEGFDGGDVRAFVRKGQAVFQKIENFPKPVVAAVNGYAFGGGCELMLSCDIVVAAENAQIGQPEVGRGLIPGWGGTQKIPRIAGKNRAMEVLLLGNRIRAAEAMSLGLVNRVVPREKVQSEAFDLAARLARGNPLALKLIKSAVLRGLQTTLEAGLELEADRFTEAFNALRDK